MKTLDQALTDYLALRRGLGFKLRQDERRLKTFLSFLQERGADHITSPLALEWACNMALAGVATLRGSTSY
jgi:integrase/recombinase XerD